MTTPHTKNELSMTKTMTCGPRADKHKIENNYLFLIIVKSGPIYDKIRSSIAHLSSFLEKVKYFNMSGFQQI